MVLLSPMLGQQLLLKSKPSLVSLLFLILFVLVNFISAGGQQFKSSPIPQSRDGRPRDQAREQAVAPPGGGASSSSPNTSGSILQPPQLNLSQIRISGAEDKDDSMDTSIMTDMEDRQLDAELMADIDIGKDPSSNVQQ